MKIKIFFHFSILFLTLASFGQNPVRNINPAYRYYANPGFVNSSELIYGFGIEDTVVRYSSFFGVENIFGYQINRNFAGGVGLGILLYKDNLFLPLFAEYRYSVYLKTLTPFTYIDAGAQLSTSDFEDESKIFLSTGLGVSRSFSPTLEGYLSAGPLIQARSTMSQITYFTLKAGVIFRKNSFRMVKPNS